MIRLKRIDKRARHTKVREWNPCRSHWCDFRFWSMQLIDISQIMQNHPSLQWKTVRAYGDQRNKWYKSNNSLHSLTNTNQQNLQQGCKACPASKGSKNHSTKSKHQSCMVALPHLSMNPKIAPVLAPVLKYFRSWEVMSDPTGSHHWHLAPSWQSQNGGEEQ